MLLVAIFITIGIASAITGCVLIFQNKDLFFSKH